MVGVLVRIPFLRFAHRFVVSAYVLVEAVLMKAAIGHAVSMSTLKLPALSRGACLAKASRKGVTRIRHIPW
jgi:hypothetical protein